MADAPEVMNVRQASAYLGVSADTLYKHLAEERIPAFRLGNRWRFKKSVLDRWMEGQSVAPTRGGGTEQAKGGDAPREMGRVTAASERKRQR
ncbi:MAG: helix-turn-helix domain-containing protein [Terriglobales bacterium]